MNGNWKKQENNCAVTNGIMSGFSADISQCLHRCLQCGIELAAQLSGAQAVGRSSWDAGQRWSAGARRSRFLAGFQSPRSRRWAASWEGDDSSAPPF